MGKSYESSFDEFEVFFALIVFDIKEQRKDHSWEPIGRFGWKHQQSNSPLSRIIAEANKMGENWEPIKSGLFDGKIERFNGVANNLQQELSRASWR